VFEIGSSLREVRVRRELELAQVERETRIRARYLRALEDERFDVPPAGCDHLVAAAQLVAVVSHQRSQIS
jgi:hypothetical protein